MTTSIASTELTDVSIARAPSAAAERVSTSLTMASSATVSSGPDRLTSGRKPNEGVI